MSRFKCDRPAPNAILIRPAAMDGIVVWFRPVVAVFPPAVAPFFMQVVYSCNLATACWKYPAVVSEFRHGFKNRLDV
jgi:hypothetical protein